MAPVCSILTFNEEKTKIYVRQKHEQETRAFIAVVGLRKILAGIFLRL